MTPTGFEPSQEKPEKMPATSVRGAPSGAVAIDPDIARILERWADLSVAIRRAILALVGGN
jgi:hypothetical protein